MSAATQQNTDRAEIIFETALAAVDAGLSIIPINWETKRPLEINGYRLAWKQFQSVPATAEQVIQWCGLNPAPLSFAAVCGKVSGGRVHIDFDVASLYPLWCEIVGSLANGLPVIKTGRGFQVVFNTAEPCANVKLAFVPDESEKDGRKCAIETRGEAGYAVLQNSLHPSGRIYETLSGDPLHPPTISAADAEMLLNAARKLCHCPQTRQQRDATEKNAKECNRSRAAVNGQGSVIDKFNQIRGITDTLEKYGYRAGAGGMFIRPGKDGPFTSVTIRDGRSFHHSSNDALNDGYWHRPFDVFCHYDHAGDCKKAVRAASLELGLNDQPSRKSTPKSKPSADDFNADDYGMPPGCDEPTAHEKKSADVTGPVLTCMASVQPQEIEWLWPQVIARGKITLLCGDPGLGKSFITVDLSARASTGASWPDAQHDFGNVAGDVILMNAEDDMADTIRPRLDAAGADVSRVHCLEGVRWTNSDGETRMKSITLADVGNIEAALQRLPNASLVCIDPISAYLGEKDSHKNAEIRGLLAPLAALASKYRVAVVVVTHLSKSGAGRAMYRAMGSLAFIAAARAAWIVAKDQENPARRLFLPIKNNIGNDQTGLAYAIVDGRIVWEPDPISTTADEAISGDGGEETGRRAPVRDSAAEWLKTILAGGPMTCADVTEAAKHSMISGKTLRLAREQLGIVPYRGRGSMNEPWYWALPAK